MSYAYFQITIKALLFKDEKLLTLRTPDGHIDFPGGRIDDDEKRLSHEEIIKREIAEELEDDIEYKFSDLLFAANREYNFKGQDHFVVALYYRLDYESGEIKLSDEHSNVDWLKPESLLSSSPNDFVSNDEYLKLKEYFKLSD